MKLILFITTILTLSILQLFSQSFEGTVVYKVNFEFEPSKKMEEFGLTKEMVLEKMKKENTIPDSTKTIYKKGDYISYTKFNPLSWSIYIQNTNKLYTFQEGDASDICTVTDVSIDLESQYSGKNPTVTKLDTIAEINGYKCEVARVQWKMGTIDYYYNSSILVVDPNLFDKHINDGLADYLKISKSLPIRIVKTTNDFGFGGSVIIYTLSSYKTEKIDDKLFLIPKLIPDKSLGKLKKVFNVEIMKIKKKK